MSLQWPDWANREDICEAKLPIHLVCIDATGESLALVGQDINKGGIWRHRGEFVAECT
jgi:hypothetical protein